MKISCEIIKDLLPLYHDDVCSKESRTLVEEHLSECTICQEELSKISKDITYPKVQTDETKSIQRIANVWKKDKMRAFIKGVAMMFLVCALLVGGFAGLTQWKVIPVPLERLEVSNVCQLADGRIVYHLYVTDDRDLHFIKYTTNDDGTYYETPYRSVIEGKRSMETGLYNDYQIIDVAEKNAYQKTYGDGVEITSCYVGSKENGILIWKKGMNLPPASEEIEKIFNY